MNETQKRARQRRLAHAKRKAATAPKVFVAPRFSDYERQKWAQRGPLSGAGLAFAAAALFGGKP